MEDTIAQPVLVLGMIDDLQRDELGAVGHHVQVGPD